MKALIFRGYLSTYYLPTYHLSTYLLSTYLPTIYLPATYLLPTYYLPTYLSTYLPTTYLPTYSAHDMCGSTLVYKYCTGLQVKKTPWRQTSLEQASRMVSKFLVFAFVRAARTCAMRRIYWALHMNFATDSASHLGRNSARARSRGSLVGSRAGWDTRSSLHEWILLFFPSRFLIDLGLELDPWKPTKQ